MSKTLFDISVAPGLADPVNCHLVMEVSAHIFSYAIVSPDKKIMQLRFYELDATNNNRLASELGDIIASEELLKADNTKKKTLVYNFPESELVPEAYFHIDTNNTLIELLHGDLNTGITLCEKVKGFNQYNVFRVPHEVYDFLQNSFPNAENRHYYSVWMESGQKQMPERATYLSILFYPNRILVSAMKDKQLHFLQSYAYEAAEDVGYYLLNICRQLQLPPATTPVLLSGMIDVSSALYTEIFKYFGNLVLESMPGISNTPAMKEYPPHFFLPLLKIAACVS